MTFLAVYFLLVPAACAFVLYKFARLWLWSSPILATLAGAVMAAVYLGGLPNPADDRWLTYWLLLMPIQQLIAISFCLGTLAGMRWGGPRGAALGGPRGGAGADDGGCHRQRPAPLPPLSGPLRRGAGAQLYRQGQKSLGRIPPGQRPGVIKRVYHTISNRFSPGQRPREGRQSESPGGSQSAGRLTVTGILEVTAYDSYQNRTPHPHLLGGHPL